MPVLIDNYFRTDWRTRTHSCEACEWQGDSRAMALEPSAEQSEYSCPQCEDILLIVQHPDLAQVQAAAAAGNAEAAEQLALLQEFQDSRH